MSIHAQGQDHDKHPSCWQSTDASAPHPRCDLCLAADLLYPNGGNKLMKLALWYQKMASSVPDMFDALRLPDHHVKIVRRGWPMPTNRR
eukprot:358772-Chlamydomonas_euryale.AAC.8